VPALCSFDAVFGVKAAQFASGGGFLGLSPSTAMTAKSGLRRHRLPRYVVVGSSSRGALGSPAAG
jgi:hypothetical protein